MNKGSYIYSALRTPLGKFRGGLSSVPAPLLAAEVIPEALNKAGVAARNVQEVILGQVIQAGVGQAPARQAALHAGIPENVPATTVNKVCGSGMKAVMFAHDTLAAGSAWDMPSSL